MTTRPHVALLVETSNTYARDLLRGIKSYMREHRPWSVYLAEHERGHAVPQWLHHWKGHGIIARIENDTIAKAILATKLPAVDVSFGLEHSPFPRVITDSLETTRLAAEHLLERGLRNFGYCGDNRYHWSRLRSGLFANHLQRAGFTCANFEGVSPARTGNDWAGEMEAISIWLRHLPKPVGVMACYDVRGQQVIEACRNLGLEIPDQVSVIGVHNDDLVCELCDPPLSSVIPNARRAGYEAAGILARMMEGEKIPPQRLLIAPVGIAARQSTDVAAVDDPQLSRAVRFIREHACEGITVEDVLKAVPMSRTVFERRFKHALHYTPHAHILAVRIKQVQSLLATTGLTLSAIAERTGFDHAEYMSVAFKRATGVSPGVYRSRSRA